MKQTIMLLTKSGTFIHFNTFEDRPKKNVARCGGFIKIIDPKKKNNNILDLKGRKGKYPKIGGLFSILMRGQIFG
jgi:hypothetical protein